MANYLAAALQGIEQGVRTGLDIYRTIEGEKRAKRMEEYQQQRDAIGDERWEMQYQRQLERDAVADEQWETAFQAKREQFAARQALEQDKFRWRQTVDQDASRRGWANVSLGQARLEQGERRLQQGEERLALQRRGTLKEVEAEVGEAFARGEQDGLALLNRSAEHRLAVATRLQRMGLIEDFDANAVGRMVLVPAGEEQYAVGMLGDDGTSVAAYDPDGDGTVLTVPRRVIAGLTGGDSAVQRLEGEQALRQAQGSVALSAEQQYAGDNAQILANAAPHEQHIADAEERLRSLSDMPLYVTSTDYRGKQVTRLNPTLAGLGGPDGVAREKVRLEEEIAASRQYLSGVLGRQYEAREQAREQLDTGLQALEDTRQGRKPEEIPAALDNTVRQLSLGMVPSAGQLGLTPDAATAHGVKDTRELVSLVDAAIKAGRPGEGEPQANEGKMSASIIGAAEKNGGLRQWLSTPNGQALLREISSEMHRRDIDYGAGFLAKVASMQRRGVQVDAGLDALQNKVIQSLPVQDREPIALLASEFMGTRTDDPAAAIEMARSAYYAGQNPATPVSLGTFR